MSTNSTDSVQNSSPTCRLLELPAELRNRIYRYTLADGQFVITQTSFAQPPLLQTCHQIRSEASSIYYYENIFLIAVGDFNHKILRAFAEQADDYFSTNMRISPVPHRTASSWTNLYARLKDWCHNGGVSMGSQVGDDLPKMHYAASEAFKIVIEMRELLEWDKIEALLMILKRATERQADGAWRWT